MFERLLCSLRELFRDRSSLFFVIVFPILLVVILGNMLAELDNPDPVVGTIRIAYTIEEAAAGTEARGAMGAEAQGADMTGAAERAAIDMFVTALADNDGIELAHAADAEAVRAAAESNAADAGMIFSTPLSISIAEGEDLYKNRAVVLIAQSFAREYAAYAAVAARNPGVFADVFAGGTPDFVNLAIDKDLGVDFTMIDFYAVTMIVMIAFMGGGIGGATQMYFARQNGLLRRLTASPRGRTRLFLESVAGVIPQNIIQAVIVMVISVLFLGAHYARTWQENLLIFAFFIVLGTAIAAVFMLIGMFLRVNPNLPLMVALWALLYMSGSFAKQINIEGFSEYLPMNIAQRAVFDLTLFGRADQLLLVMGICAVILAVSCALGAFLFRRKEIMF